MLVLIYPNKVSLLFLAHFTYISGLLLTLNKMSYICELRFCVWKIYCTTGEEIILTRLEAETFAGGGHLPTAGPEGPRSV